ncbi:PREDICTED: E3 ubiquitin-protein ligase UBR4-like, partial [Priapulus caudatus]|uniref:E3 ubiquitin-protein ligase UBR4-like n=1 Tax=Priapulus caudatus TaxID=37621 RepID=A0ABM1EQA8_PRICU
AGQQAGAESLSLSSQSQASGHLSEGGHYSDTTASAAGSDDDEGSTAATDGSTLRTSPAEQAGSQSSESEHSNIDSVEQNVSGRSSAYGDVLPESATGGVRSETSSVGIPYSGYVQPEGAEETDLDTSYRLHSLRLLLLDRLTQELPELREVGGVRAIPFMQVLLMLSSDLDSDEDADKAALDR